MPLPPVPPRVGDVRDAWREVTAACSPAEARRLAESDAGFDRVTWRQLGSRGLLGLHVPASLGGSGATLVELAAALDETGAALFPVPLVSTVLLAATALLVAGDDDVAAEHVPALVAGEEVATLALVEDSGRWDEAGVTAVARRSPGHGFLLDGHKSYVLDGHAADMVVVVARRLDDGHPGGGDVGLFVVERGAPGLTSTPLVTMDQTRRQARLELSSTPARPIDDGGAGWSTVERLLDLAATGLAAEQVGGAARCLDASVAYACRRVQFGRPIASFQAVKHACTDMALAVEAARAASACGDGDGDGDGDGHGDGDLAVAAPVAKVWCSQAYVAVAEATVQVHGGVGLTWDHEAARHLKRAVSSRVVLGDPAHHRRLLARRLGL
jgi:alkylation response protein AidB-like acyl-CoA dehydrogenase